MYLIDDNDNSIIVIIPDDSETLFMNSIVIYTLYSGSMLFQHNSFLSQAFPIHTIMCVFGKKEEKVGEEIFVVESINLILLIMFSNLYLLQWPCTERQCIVPPEVYETHVTSS